ncbi:hypothetical protein KSS87_020754 [Heliosperma pusillum]|nr:hypothetical protein KSS87_020754 [Heliosperma pusillum]
MVRMFFLVFLILVGTVSSSLSPTGVNYEVVALMSIKNELDDPYNALENWDINSVDPCSWRMITCSQDGYVSAFFSLEWTCSSDSMYEFVMLSRGLPSQSLTGKLSPAIQNLTKLESVMKTGTVNCFVICMLTYRRCFVRLLQNNAMSGSIPTEIGKLEMLQTLDLSNNKFIGEIPSSLGGLKNLNYLRLNNNSLTGHCPDSLAELEGLTLVDLSFNNLSGSVPKISARTFKIIGNPLICRTSGANCSMVSPEALSFPPDALKGLSNSGGKGHHFATTFGASSGAVLLVIAIIGLGIWWWYRRNRQIFFDVNEQYDPETCLGHLKRYSFKELRSATNHFNSKNILGQGGFGIVFKGTLNDGTLVAVKRLKDYNITAGEIQFQTEVETIGLAVHRNLLRLCGFCSTENERLLVYPYMPNGSVASRLKDHIHGRPALDWSRRRNIALGTARGLLYLHEQCDPKIIHRDVKAANILLDEDFEAVVGDFGLAKLLDHRDSHVTTAVRGTVGHIAPEYLSTGQSSEKTDVFGYGILLLELITGQKALDFGRASNQKGVMLDWLNLLVDTDLKNYDMLQLGEMVQVALLCTQFNPSNRPKMSEVLRILEGDGLAEKWEDSQRFETPRSRSGEPVQYSDYMEESSLVVEAMELSGPR